MKEQFIYSSEYQIKVLSYMLHNLQFKDIAAEVLERSHFADRALQWYYDVLTQAEIPLTPSSLKEELLKAAKTKQIKDTEVDKVVEYYSVIKQPPMPAEEEHIQSTFSKFIRTQAMKKAILESVDLIKEEQWDTVLEKIESARNTGLDILTIGHNYFTDFENRLQNRVSFEETRKLSTGIPELDSLMFGGLKTKQMGLIVGGSGKGKSIMLQYLARAAVLLGTQVVYYTLELSEEDIADRFDSLFCNIRPQELRSLNNKVYTDMHKYHAQFGNNLIIKGYPEDEASINTIKSHYKQLASIGVTPGLVLVDYIDLMKPHRKYHNKHDEQEAIVKALRGMSKKFNTRIWTALQFNRGGMVQETPDESAIAGSISRFFTSDICVFLAQTPDEKEDQTMRLVIKKNRLGPSEKYIKIATDFAHMKMYNGQVNDTALQDNRLASVDQSNAPTVEEVPADDSGMVVLD